MNTLNRFHQHHICKEIDKIVRVKSNSVAIKIWRFATPISLHYATGIESIVVSWSSVHVR